MENAETAADVTPKPPEANGAKEATSKSKKADSKQPIDLHPPAGSKPTRQLPTTRIAFGKQLDLLRAYHVASGPAQNAVTLGEVAPIIKIAAQTASLANPFFLEAGLLRKTETGRLLPSQAVREFGMAHEFGSNNPAHKLGAALIQTWFWQAFERPLRLSRQMQEQEVISELAMAAGASATHRPQLLQLLMFLEAGGLIEREGSVVRIGPVAAGNAVTTAPIEQDAEDSVSGAAAPPAASGRTTGQPTGSAGLATGFTQGPEGIMRFHISVNVDMAEMRDWKPDRIAALFAGIAQVLAAKADVEQGASDEV